MSSSLEKTTDSPLYSPSIFIGRNDEIATFLALLDNPEKRILHIEAAGGMGKTKLLEELLFTQLPKFPRDKTAIYPNQLIDLYHTHYQIELGILTTIANQFPSTFVSFTEKVKEYRQTKQNPEQLRSLFIECYSKLKANYIILFFDTLEIISESIKDFFTKVFPTLLEKQPNTFIVTAGRNPFPIKSIQDKVFTLKLEGFKEEDINEYFEHSEIKPLIESSIDENVKGKLLSRIFELSNGKPILIALTVDWIHNGNFIESLLDVSKEEFEQQLVERVNLLSQTENKVILAMSHFHKRFNSKILLKLFPDNIHNIDEANNLIGQLRRFSFVKYHNFKSSSASNETESFLLHDEMRDLVKKHIIASLDSSGLFFKSWTKYIIEYYDDEILKLTDSREELKLELCNLQREKLYYFCIYDFNAAFEYYLEVRKQIREEPWDIRESFIKVLDEYEQRMTKEQRYQYWLYSSYILYDRGQYEEYFEKADEILSKIDSFSSCIEQDSVIYECQAKTIGKKIQALTNTGKINEAIAFGEKHNDFFEGKTQLEIKIQRGHFLGAMGYAFRRQGDKQNPKQYYEDAIKCYLDCNTDKKNFYLASTKINLAFVEHLSGQDFKAIAYCKQALKHSKDNNIQWRANNVLGIIEADSQRENEAKKYFEFAHFYAIEAIDKRGSALIYIAQARMYRQKGRYKIFDRKKIEPALTNYEKADEFLDKAIALLGELSTSPDLAEAYTEKGLLLREQNKFKEALEFFDKSYDLATKNHNDYLRADNLQRIAVTYYYCGDNEQAKNKAQEAIMLAEPLSGLHIIAKAQRVLADIAYQNQEYDKCFDCAYNSIIYLLQIDVNSQDDSMPKKERSYNESCDWLTRLLDKLTDEVSCKYREQMIEKWGNFDGNSLGIDKNKWVFDLMIR